MFPILYEQITVGTVPQNNGLGALSDCISCIVEQERNGAYELTMEYPMSGIHASDIAVRRVLKVKPNFTDDPQLFRIDRVGKEMNGTFMVYAKHISYDLSGYEITSGSANSIIEACTLLQNKANGYSITTDKSTSGTFNVDVPASVKSFFVGKEGSIADVYSPVEIKYDNFNVQFLAHAGQNRGVTIKYGKNLTELSQELDGENLYTDVMCFYKEEGSNAVVGNKVSTDLHLDTPKCYILDVSNEYESAPSVATLTARAVRFKNENNLTTPTNNITLNFVQSDELPNRVDLCDTVDVYYEALGITRVGVKCIRVKWDCIREKYAETEFGDAVSTVADTIALNNKQLSETPTTSVMESAIAHATELITGNLGGYVINGHDSNGDGLPDENLIMNTPDINTATKVIRANLGGIGFSTNGYAGPFTTAINYEGIVADAITTGTLNANLIKAGVLSDAQGNSTINMTNGSATMNEFKSKMKFTLVNASNAGKADFYISSGNTYLTMRPSSTTTDLVKIWAQDANGAGVFQLLRSNGNLLVEAGTTGLGGGIGLHNNDNKVNVELRTGDAQQGELLLYGKNGSLRVAEYGHDDGGVYNLFNSVNKCVIAMWASGGAYAQFRNAAETTNIELDGNSGRVLCVSCVQTSSRKVKENIKPIADADKILELDAVSFDYKNKEQGTDKRGFVAEDVAKVLPNLVSEERDGIPATLDYTQMIPYLQTVIKEQQKQIADLTKRVDALEKARS